MPEIAYFREPSTQSMLLDILFIYCKLNRDIGYRQGMHEVLAPVVWVVSRDAIDPKSLGKGHEDLDKYVISALDQQYVEHDAFTLFGAIMQTVKNSYEMGSNNEPTTSGLMNNSPIVERSKRIHENYLHHADPELAEHLAAIEILPQIFLIRWIRLLFGREFPFKDVLILWDSLFAEDPGLDLVDLIAVAMLLRIRWQRKSWVNEESKSFLTSHVVLEADYSAALTLLLRYPIPQSPHGPATFVGDALYLRENLLLDGGDHIISKYSRRAPETTVTRKLPKKIKRARTAEQEAAQTIALPKAKPGRSGQGQGGIEGIIHEAAKGMYIRGEKWGVGKALRGAVQGLQSGHSSPRRISGRSNQSSDHGKVTSDNAAETNATVQALEQRNKSLAKLLENAVGELWVQQKQIHGNDEAAADALSLSIAKVQFVQVYLENSTVPLPTDATPPSDVIDNGDAKFSAEQSRIPPVERQLPPLSAQVDGCTDGKPVNPGVGNAVARVLEQTEVEKSPPSTPKMSSPPPRPSLEKSPFSWMLGEDQPKSGFVVASPFQSEKKSDRSGNLFGDGGRNTNRKVRSKATTKDRTHADVNDDDDVFTMGRSKGRSEK